MTNAKRCAKLNKLFARAKSLRAVPCKLNNAKMTFITFGQNKVLIDKLSQRKFLSKFARANESEDYDLKHFGALDTIFLRV